MTASLGIDQTSRLLVLAPHPDDESAAAGGLLQRSARAGAAIRVVFVTDGDNNPWPQRALERRMRIGAVERSGWGARRREEALVALARLGVPAGSARFLGKPDQGLTALLLEEPNKLATELALLISEFAPSHLVFPSRDDRHPDHSALAVLTRLALLRLPARPAPPLALTYLLHGGLPDAALAAAATLHLDPAEQDRKRDALECHHTQIALFPSRLLRHAGAHEHFLKPDLPSRGSRVQPVRLESLARGTLALRAKLPRWPARKFRRGVPLYLLALAPDGAAVSLSLEVNPRGGECPVRIAQPGASAGRALAERAGNRILIRVPLPAYARHRIFVKLPLRGIFFDRAGWLELTPGARRSLAAGREIKKRAPRIVCVVPCFNVERLCSSVVLGAARHAHRVIAVDDGSTDGTRTALTRAAEASTESVEILSLPANHGKGVALMAGFRRALDTLSFDVLVTLDGDQQHRPEDIPALVHRCLESRADLVVGERDSFARMPLRSRIGNIWMRSLLRGLDPTYPCDTQSGMRAYGRTFVEEIVALLPGARYETETRILMLAVRLGRRICATTIPTLYSHGNRSSHFRPLRDSLRILWAVLFSTAKNG